MAQGAAEVGGHIGEHHVLADVEQDRESHEHGDLLRVTAEEISEGLLRRLLSARRRGERLGLIEFHPQPQGDAAEREREQERQPPPAGIHSVAADEDEQNGADQGRRDQLQERYNFKINQQAAIIFVH